MRISRSHNVLSLEISSATLEDSGKYSVKAQNELGQCCATSSLHVHSEYPPTSEPHRELGEHECVRASSLVSSGTLHIVL